MYLFVGSNVIPIGEPKPETSVLLVFHHVDVISNDIMVLAPESVIYIMFVLGE